jgi:hypothetical protein
MVSNTFLSISYPQPISCLRCDIFLLKNKALSYGIELRSPTERQVVGHPLQGPVTMVHQPKSKDRFLKGWPMARASIEQHYSGNLCR